jgi:hypothetical protein
MFHPYQRLPRLKKDDVISTWLKKRKKRVEIRKKYIYEKKREGVVRWALLL